MSNDVKLCLDLMCTPAGYHANLSMVYTWRTTMDIPFCFDLDENIDFFTPIICYIEVNIIELMVNIHFILHCI